MAASDAFYIGLRDTSDAILAEFGTTFTVRSPGTYDEDELESVPGTTRDIIGVIADQRSTVEIAGSGSNLIGEKNLLMQASANPAQGEEVLVDGEWFPLSELEPIKPADITVVYILDVTR